MTLAAQRLQVLLVEDDAILAFAMREFLVASGYVVETVGDGEQALRAFADRPADVLVTDLNMPRLHGRDLIIQLRQTWPFLPVVVVTGCMPTDRLADIQRDHLGPTVLVEKPASPEYLLAVLDTVFTA